MRILFASESRASALARRLRKALLKIGTPLSLVASKEAFSRACGYRNWNELSDVAARAATDDLDAFFARHSDADVASSLSGRLSAELGLTRLQARDVVADFGPVTSRPAQLVTDDVMHFLAVRLSRRLADADEFEIGGLRGFRGRIGWEALIGNGLQKAGSASNVFVVVSDDGSKAFGGNADRGVLENREAPEGLDYILFAAGIREIKGSTVEDAKGQVADPRVAATLRRLNRTALSVLWGAAYFEHSTYERACLLPPTSPLPGLAVRYPGLGTYYSMYCERRGVRGRLKAFLDGSVSDDPVAAFSDAALAASKDKWPGLEVGPRKASSVVRRLLGIVPNHEDTVVTPDLAAFLCQFPERGLPRDGDQLAAVARFYYANERAFEKPGMGVTPDGFFADFEALYGGDWSELRGDLLMNVYDLASEVGSVILYKAAAEQGVVLDYPWQLEETDEAYGVGRAYCFEQSRTFFDALAKRRMADGGWDGDGWPLQRGEQAYDHLFVAGYVAGRHRKSSATQLVMAAGFDVVKVLEAVNGPVKAAKAR